MAKQCHTNDTLHLTWGMCRGSLASALNYDAMIIPLEGIQPHLDQVTQMVRNVVDTIAATRLSDDAHCAASLMPFFGGAGMRVPTALHADAMILGTYMSNRRRMLGLASSLGVPFDPSRHDRSAELCRQRLHAAGIQVTWTGGVRIVGQAKEEYDQTPWSLDLQARWLPLRWTARGFLASEESSDCSLLSTPFKGLIGSVMRAIDGIAAARLYLRSSPADRLTLHASGGPMQGNIWGWPPVASQQRLFSGIAPETFVLPTAWE